MAFSDQFESELTSKTITERYNAPIGLREYLGEILFQFTIPYKTIRSTVCTVTYTAPDPNNWSENDFMVYEIKEIIKSCNWPFVYDIIESFSKLLITDSTKSQEFERKINRYFFINGIGWILKSGKIEFRGDKSFEIAKQASETLQSSPFATSSNEMHEALTDLSRRPEPDCSGAIQHSLAALECLTREITDDRSLTLGQLIKKHSEIIPQPLNDVVSKLWGFASNKGRHLSEGNSPTLEDAELVVHTSAILCSYLSKTIMTKQ